MNKKQKCIISFIPSVCVFSYIPAMAESTHAEPDKRPNVIVLLTDDQGIGGLGCMGNELIHTPNMDAFAAQSVSLTNFHVSPMSTPTRSAIITGRYPIRNGAWATFKGRDVVSRRTPTIAEVFFSNGYSTAMFGKWHLGDNYPQRPTDSGFQYAVQHLSGGVGELSDYWGNNYFDDVYLVNNKPRQFKGYCTDVWFDQAMKYMKANKGTGKPMFIYLATNAPHGPHYVDKKYSEQYEYLKEKGVLQDSGFYGQISNIDENFGKLRKFLIDEELEDNTILILMTDNGAGIRNNARTYGYSGAKGSKLEGGHRVFFFMRWPQGRIDGGRKIPALTAHVDLFPTLTSMCGIKCPDNAELDGVDFSPLLFDDCNITEKRKFDDRVVFVHHRQDYKQPFDVRESCIMKDEWRLIDGNKLYDLVSDRKQKRNIASNNTKLVDELLASNSAFIEKTKELPEYKDFVMPVAGSDNQNVTVLTIQHAIGDDAPLWKSEQIAEGVMNKNDKHVVFFDRPGRYRISLSRWPRECQGKICGIPSVNPKNQFNYNAIIPEKAYLSFNGKSLMKRIEPEMSEVEFIVDTNSGRGEIQAGFIFDDQKMGAYYIYIQRIN